MNHQIPAPLVGFDAMRWPFGPNKIELPQNTIHVWAASLRHDPAKIEQLRQILTEDERARADRFYFEKDREAYTAARGQLRLLLGRYLQLEPNTIRFTYSSYGKPSLAEPFAKSGLHFNVTHSHDLAIYGFIWDNELGIDVEYKYRKPTPDFVGISTHFFAPSEQAVLGRHQGEAALREAFYRCWTRKEAYLKASGEGLSRALDSFHVTLTAHEPAKLLYVKNEPQEVERWTMMHINVNKEYTAAMCVEGNNLSMSCWRLI
ncbi:MAG: 4'-phosphopantetheinyl transferase family protein [Ardenticatenaceae bacterium]